MEKPIHPEFKCTCGAEHGHLTDHDQTERLCPEHASGSGYAGGEPIYAKGKEAPEQFESFKAEHPEKFPAEPEKKSSSEEQPKKKK